MSHTAATTITPGAGAPVRPEALRLRPAEERGHANHGWLRSAHSFSFAGYHDPQNMSFEALRVINDDRIRGGAGFPTHPHQDAEIFSYVLKGALAHKDTMGTSSTVAAGGVQFMSAGSGVAHSEFNASATEEVHLLQIWLLPKRRGVTPRYDTLDVRPEDKDGRFVPIVSEDGAAGGIATHAPANVYAATLREGQDLHFALAEGRRAFVQIARGTLEVNGQTLTEGDGLKVLEPGGLAFTKGQEAEFLLFDLEHVSAR